MTTTLAARTTPIPARIVPVVTYLRDESIVLLPLVAIAFLVAAPLLALLTLSLHEGTLLHPKAWTLDNYGYAIRLPRFWEALSNTVVVSAVSSVFTVSISFLFAYIVERTTVPWRNLVWAAIVLPIAIPGIFGTLGLVLAFSPNQGWGNLALRPLLELLGMTVTTGPINIYSLGGLIFLDAISGSTVVFLMLAAPLRMMDPALEEASAMSGADAVATFRRVTLPMLLPAVLAAYIYSFISSMDSFESALIAGLPGGIFMLSTLIYYTSQLQQAPDVTLGATFSVLFMLIMLLLVAFYQYAVRHGLSFATVRGKAYRPRRIALGWWRWPILSAIAIYLVLQVVLPLVIILYASLLPQMVPPSPAAFGQMSFDTYRKVFSEPGLVQAFVNTGVLTVIAPTVAVLLAFVTSWIIVRRKRLLARAAVDGLVFLPHAIPGQVVAIGLIIVFLTQPFSQLPVYGSVAIIVLALVVGFLPFATRIMNVAVIQLHPELEEAAHVSGATRGRTLVHVILPLLMPAIAAGWILAATRTMRSFSTPLFLGGPGSEVVSVRMYNYWEAGALPETAAVGMLFLVMTAPLAYLARRSIGRTGQLER